MAQKQAGIFGPSISLWQHGATLACVAGAVFLWPSPWGGAALLVGIIAGGVVEGIVMAAKRTEQ